LISVQNAEKARTAYREFRRIQHRQRLNSDSELSGAIPADSALQTLSNTETERLNNDRLAVIALWEEVFGA